MIQERYAANIFKIEGESIEPQPTIVFDSTEVYLVIDKPVKIIWIWAGKKSRLFHRYVAATWAGKLKSQKKYYGFKYEIIKENQEPREFLAILGENSPKGESEAERVNKAIVYSSNSNVEIPPRQKLTPKNDTQSYQSLTSVKRATYLLLNSDKTQIIRILSEIKEIQSHVNYSLKHVDQRIQQVEAILKRLNKTS